MSNIITIKLKLKENISDNIYDFQRKFSNVVRYSFNRFMDGCSRQEVFNLVKTLNNIDELDITWRREAAKLAESIYKSKKEKGDDSKIIFGGKSLFFNRLKGKVSRDEFLNNRKLFYISCEGSKADNKGNRKFKFDVDTLSGSVKLNGKAIQFACHKTSKGQSELMKKMEKLAHLGESGITYRINSEYFYFLVDLEKLPKKERKTLKDRTLALDMNPDYIGLSIMDGNENIVLKKCYDLSKITENNKRKYELTEIAKDVSELCLRYDVCLVGYEKLKINPKDNKKGKRFNRQVNNDWKRKRFITSLHKWLGLIGCQWREVLPQYSSFIGCIMHPDETDSIAASLELNRRLREYKKIYIDKEKPVGNILYPEIAMHLFNRWKESIGDKVFSDWVEAYKWFKETRHSYRLTYPKWLETKGVRPLRFKSMKSKVKIALA